MIVLKIKQHVNNVFKRTVLMSMCPVGKWIHRETLTVLTSSLKVL